MSTLPQSWREIVPGNAFFLFFSLSLSLSLFPSGDSVAVIGTARKCAERIINKRFMLFCSILKKRRGIACLVVAKRWDPVDVSRLARFIVTTVARRIAKRISHSTGS
jgi:hypothetical protein